MDEIARRPICHRAGAKDHAVSAQLGASRRGSKAAFFLRFGFCAGDWQRPAEALLLHAQENDVVETEQTEHGVRHVVDGPLTAPDGTRLNVRSAWYINPGSSAPRFVSAHPLPKL